MANFCYFGLLIMEKKVLVSGCFDMLHSGHVAFIRSAAVYGKVYVCLGSDQTVFELKKRYPVNNEQERKFMLEALKDVHEVCISSGNGYLDFLPELERIQPDIFVVNEDGVSEEKKALCETKNIELIVLPRQPHAGLPARSTSDLRKQNQIPYRLDLAGGWLDQPFVSLHASGPVLTICLEPTHLYNERSGMATSTRKIATELWTNQLPFSNSEQVAKMLFAYENPPGKTEVAGSQDAIGIVYSGLAKSWYDGKYWPTSIESCLDNEVLNWLEQHIFLVPLAVRKDGYDVLANTAIHKIHARALSEAAQACYQAILEKNLQKFGATMRAAFEAQISMFPNMVDEDIMAQIKKHENLAYGWKLSGAGGGGYLVLVADKPIPGAENIKIRRKESTQ